MRDRESRERGERKEEAEKRNNTRDGEGDWRQRERDAEESVGRALALERRWDEISLVVA